MKLHSNVYEVKIVCFFVLFCFFRGGGGGGARFKHIWTWWPSRGQGLFPLYMYIHIENFKNHLVRNHSTDFNISLQKCFFGDPLPRLFKPS